MVTLYQQNLSGFRIVDHEDGMETQRYCPYLLRLLVRLLCTRNLGSWRVTVVLSFGFGRRRT
jgi:hypothetical protein